MKVCMLWQANNIVHLSISMRERRWRDFASAGGSNIVLGLHICDPQQVILFLQTFIEFHCHFGIFLWSIDILLSNETATTIIHKQRGKFLSLEPKTLQQFLLYKTTFFVHTLYANTEIKVTS